ncbi:MAG: quinone-dependent dihydroorotate dehydrogenase [Cyclobacteriaceae bacterium]|nr:quinone-dependent dihydroorotate dehydrogenase [Cyclobacteriaceae bacterium]
MLYKYFIRPLLFLFNPEQAHFIATTALKIIVKIPGGRRLLQSLYTFRDKRLERVVFGIRFPNPVGLAAGFDKEAEFMDAFSALGFGFIEIGTVTPVGQLGNPKPRLFRLKKDRALINRMGFNNDGVAGAAMRLKKRRPGIIVGGNIGKNKLTPIDQALSDYLKCFEALYDSVDYFAVNVSSPNTPNLRELQEKEPLKQLLAGLLDANSKKKHQKPILLKIAPDLTNSQLDDILEIVDELNLPGVIATNTTISRKDLTTDQAFIDHCGAGGLSGAPVRNRSTEVIRYLKQNAKKPFPIIGVGGIDSPEAALEKLEAGASLVQVYTGFIYEGPGLSKRINKAIAQQAD